MHGLGFGSALILTVTAIAAVDEFPVDISAVCLDYGTDRFRRLGSSLGGDSLHISDI